MYSSVIHGLIGPSLCLGLSHRLAFRHFACRFSRRRSWCDGSAARSWAWRLRSQLPPAHATVSAFGLVRSMEEVNSEGAEVLVQAETCKTAGRTTSGSGACAGCWKHEARTGWHASGLSWWGLRFCEGLRSMSNGALVEQPLAVRKSSSP